MFLTLLELDVHPRAVDNVGNLKPPMRYTPRLLCLALLFITPAAIAQEQVGPPIAPSQLPQGWVPLDGVAIVVNSDTITRRAIERFIEGAMAEAKVTTRQEYMALVQEAQRSQVENLLMKQAGEDLGFPPEMVEAHVRGRLEDQRDEAGGTFEMARKLREDETTATEIREELTQETLEMEWRRKIAGFAAPGARTSEDRFSRPGSLAQRYRRIQRTGRDVDPLFRFGAKPATYELQLLLLLGQTYGSMEEARKVAQQAKAALESGEAEWDDLIANIGNFENQGLTGARRIEELQFGLDPGDGSLVQFIMEGNLESYSQVLPFPRVNPATGERQIAGFAIYRLLGRQDAVLPPYTQPGIQKELARVMGYQGDEQRVQLALEDLERTAYIWYPGIEEQQAEFERRIEERKQAIEEARRRNAASQEGPNNEPQEAPAEPSSNEGAPPASGAGRPQGGAPEAPPDSPPGS